MCLPIDWMICVRVCHHHRRQSHHRHISNKLPLQLELHCMPWHTRIESQPTSCRIPTAACNCYTVVLFCGNNVLAPHCSLRDSTSKPLLTLRPRPLAWALWLPYPLSPPARAPWLPYPPCPLPAPGTPALAPCLPRAPRQETPRNRVSTPFTPRNRVSRPINRVSTPIYAKTHTEQCRYAPSLNGHVWVWVWTPHI